MGRPAVEPPNAAFIIPVLDWTLCSRLVRSMAPEVAAGAMCTNNTRGGSVAGAWNRGRAVVLAGDPLTGWHPEWLVICSTSTTFGRAGGRDLLAELDPDGKEQVSVIDGGWHLHAIPRRVLEIIGPFDEGFAPAYCEDSDFIRRHELAGLGDMYAGDGQRHVHVDATWLPDGESIRTGLCDHNVPARSLAKYVEKWGGTQRNEVFDTPFGREGVDWRWLWRDEAKANGWPITEVTRWGLKVDAG